MALASVETGTTDSKLSVTDRIVDAARSAAHLSHEARLLKSVAEDAIEDGIHAAKRGVKQVQRRVEDLADLKDDAIRAVKRQPVAAVAASFGVGIALGAAFGWLAARRRCAGKTP
jgi:ElaB/YqjD/DUF883 family membrane-anchored ribosome-binding protein